MVQHTAILTMANQ